MFLFNKDEGVTFLSSFLRNVFIEVESLFRHATIKVMIQKNAYLLLIRKVYLIAMS